MPEDRGSESIKLALAGQTQWTVNSAHFGLTASRAAVQLDYANEGHSSSSVQTGDSAHFTVLSVQLS